MCWKCDHPDSTMQEWLEVIYAPYKRNGWVVQFVSDRTPYAYTIGLHPRGLPELLVTGMPPAARERTCSIASPSISWTVESRYRASGS